MRLHGAAEAARGFRLAPARPGELTFERHNLCGGSHTDHSTLRWEAFPFTRYGTLDGEVTEVSDDAIEDEKQGLLFTARIAVPKRKASSGRQIAAAISGHDGERGDQDRDADDDGIRAEPGDEGDG